MKLKIYLLENHITIKEFAEKIGYSRSQISNIINGASKPSKRLINTIEEATNGLVTIKDLMA